VGGEAGARHWPDGRIFHGTTTPSKRSGPYANALPGKSGSKVPNPPDAWLVAANCVCRPGVLQPKESNRADVWPINLGGGGGGTAIAAIMMG